MHPSSFNEKQREELKGLMVEAINEYFEAKGRLSKHWLITIASVIGAVTVILGGLKILLGWLGFTYATNAAAATFLKP